MFANRKPTLSWIVLRIVAVIWAATWTVRAATYYADASRPNDGGPANTWATAKKSIQAAVALANEGDTVLVTNGTYSTGSMATPGYALQNRVAITKAITVRSVNGPDVTSTLTLVLPLSHGSTARTIPYARVKIGYGLITSPSQENRDRVL